MTGRLELQSMLEAILGTRNVYFQPPESLIMSYPCIRYERDLITIKSADNRPYTTHKRYLVTVIDKNPDSEIPDHIASLPQCSFSRHFTADGLNHDVFNLYY